MAGFVWLVGVNGVYEANDALKRVKNLKDYVAQLPSVHWALQHTDHP